MNTCSWKTSIPSLKSRLLTIIIFQIMLALLFITASVFVVTNGIFNSYCTGTEQFSRSMVSQLNFQFEEMSRISELPAIMVNGSYSELNKTLNASEEWTSATSNLVKNEFQAHLNSRPFIDTLCVCNTRGQGVFLQQDIFNFYDSQADIQSPWFCTVIHSKGEAIPFSRVSADSTGILKRTRAGKIYNTPVSGVTRAIRNPLTSTNIGVITLTLNEDSILSDFMDSRLYDNQQMILCLNDNLFMASDETYISQVTALTRPKTITFIGGRLHMIHYFTSRLFGLWIYTPLYDIFTNSSVLVLILLSDIFLFSLVIRSINSTIKSITDPLGILTDACRRFSMDSFRELNTDDAPEEFKPLFFTFNEMYSRLNKLINDIYIKDIEQKNLEINYLRSQINPHYLYNTLECLHLMAYTNKDYEVALMSELLGKNLQYGLNTQSQEVTFQTELEKVQEYVNLISFSCKDRIHVHYGIDPAILPSLTLRMIIQPILENSYVHGLSKECTKLSIEILGYRSKDLVIIKISDDGTGIPHERLRHLQCQLSSNEPSQSLGINNVNRRIQLFYGSEFGLQIDSRQKQGTLITITLPYHKSGIAQPQT